MGLNIYFYKVNRERHEDYINSYHTYLRRLDNWYHHHNNGEDLSDEEKLELDTILKQEPEDDSKDVAYFQKANFLLRFFDYEENYTEVYIEQDKIDELVERCKEVLQDHGKADELLPMEPGFSYGSTGYDDYYYHDVQHVLNMFENIHLNPNDSKDGLIMCCWW